MQEPTITLVLKGEMSLIDTIVNYRGERKLISDSSFEIFSQEMDISLIVDKEQGKIVAKNKDYSQSIDLSSYNKLKYGGIIYPDPNDIQFTNSSIIVPVQKTSHISWDGFDSYNLYKFDRTLQSEIEKREINPDNYHRSYESQSEYKGFYSGMTKDNLFVIALNECIFNIAQKKAWINFWDINEMLILEEHSIQQEGLGAIKGIIQDSKTNETYMIFKEDDWVIYHLDDFKLKRQSQFNVPKDMSDAMARYFDIQKIADLFSRASLEFLCHNNTLYGIITTSNTMSQFIKSSKVNSYDPKAYFLKHDLQTGSTQFSCTPPSLAIKKEITIALSEFIESQHSIEDLMKKIPSNLLQLPYKK